MIKIDEIRIENLPSGCVTDNSSPVVSFAMNSDVPDTRLENAIVKIGNWEKKVEKQTGIVCEEAVSDPFTEYSVHIIAKDNHGAAAEKTAMFQSGRMGMKWEAHWITDKSYQFSNGTSPAPMTFFKKFTCNKKVKRAYITATAIGIYELILNGKKAGTEYFAPGYTDYKYSLQYQYYDVTDYITSENKIVAVVGGGWAVGRFTYKSKSKITEERQAFLMELFVEYEDGELMKVITDSSWRVTEEGNYRFGDFYDGETYDATIDINKVVCKNADLFHPRINPKITAQYGCSVTEQERMIPVECFPAKNGEMIYDFGQNFAGVVSLKITGTNGQKIIVRHAETLFEDDLCVNSLRTAKATITYICNDGTQTYSPRLTYMGFRYIGISGINPQNIEVSALVLHSDMEEIGSFECSEPMLNKLQSNIRWSGKSNFVDVPTDCPQRDERLGWTGDIAIFASTACYNFDMSRFLDKWLVDVRSAQGKGGGLPFVIPKETSVGPVVATACWGDSCIIVPWAEYLARGDLNILEQQYPTMKRFLKAAKWWAGLFSIRKNHRRIWKYLFQFGDWCAPGNGTDVKGWLKKGPWMGTAYFANSCDILAKVAALLGKQKESKYYAHLREEICSAYINVFTDGNGKLKQEFQTGYVLPIYFQMAKGNFAGKMAENLNRLVIENNYHLSTGFVGTPYLLFALADQGYVDTAYRVLLQDTCPSWIYEIKNGGTTFWEQWDAVKEGTENDAGRHCISDSSVSFNHYAYGAVGDFLYRRLVGIEPIEGGYKKFSVHPVIGGGITSAKGSVKSPYGKIQVEWNICDEEFCIKIKVPVSTECEITLPSGQRTCVASGEHTFMEKN